MKHARLDQAAKKEGFAVGLWQNFQDEPVSRLSLREPVTAKPSDTLREVIARMRDRKLGCAIVADDEDKPIGIFTESTLTQLLNKHGSSVVDDRLEKHMTSPCPWVQLTDPIAFVVEAMQLKNIRFLCVVDGEGRIARLTGQKGLIEFVADHIPGQIMVQRIGGQPFPSDREGA
jgi:CBS domain-containing protein